MKIAIVHPMMDVKGGAENIVIWLANGLRQRGHDVRIIAETFEPSHWPAEMTESLDVRTFPSLRFNRFFKSRWLELWERTRQLKGMLADIDLVIAQHFPAYCWAVQARGFWSKRKVVWLCQEPSRWLYSQQAEPHLHQLDKLTPPGVDNEHLAVEIGKPLTRSARQKNKDEQKRKLDAAGAAKCDLVITNSRFTAGNVERIFGIRPVVCNLGIPLSPEPAYRPGEYVGVLTTLHARKNVQNVIRAIAELSKRGRDDIPLKIAGRGPDREALEELARKLDVAERVVFLGGLDDEQLPEFLANARLVVYVPIDEPFGLVPLESLAMKTPVVASNQGGPLETVEDELTGIHVNPFDPVSIADGIERLWTDLDANHRMGESGCQIVREKFSLEAFVERFETIIS